MVSNQHQIEKILEDAVKNSGTLMQNTAPHAMKSIVADIVRNDVTSGFRAATFFFKF